VGAVAVHGYAGVVGLVIAGFVLWGAPSSPYEGYASINPIGQTLGAIIMFFGLGFLPAFIVAKMQKAAVVLRIPEEVELEGLDYAEHHAYEDAKQAIIEADKEHLSKKLTAAE
jgi:ammonia channel protein AmtB